MREPWRKWNRRKKRKQEQFRNPSAENEVRHEGGNQQPERKCVRHILHTLTTPSQREERGPPSPFLAGEEARGREREREGACGRRDQPRNFKMLSSMFRI